jgi:hypothetical protein
MEQQMETVIDSTRAMLQRWEGLAREIGSARATIADRKPGGALTIIGSGIAHADFTLNDEALIRSAGRVFHCTNDRVTQVWIGGLRPDSFDLRVLYDGGKSRYDTYVQMAEALLHGVRRGEHVVAVFYGHPGFFATPAHRAIEIARAEGYRARMRPGISALDYLVADVGFDPMIPGLISYDASELVISNRAIDSRLHAVFWQVGMVCDFEFSPSGFANCGFGRFVGKLAASYGEAHRVTHYVASQYSGVDPLIEEFEIARLLDHEVRARFSWLSTLHVAPLPFSVDHQGLPHERIRPAYGIAEDAALDRLSSFAAPAHYAMPEETPAAAFMLRLSRDLELQERYRADPASAVALAKDAETHMSNRAKTLLGMGHPLAIAAAMAEPAALGGTLARSDQT